MGVNEIVQIEGSHSSKCWAFNVNPHKCHNPNYFENYLKFNALNDVTDGMGTTYLFLKDDNLRGYVTLRASSLIKKIEGVNYGYPAIEISVLAVDKQHEGNGVGTDMLDFVFVITQEIKASIGIQYVLLCAEPMAVEFYKKSKFNFQELRDIEDIPREYENVNSIAMYVKL